MSAKKMKNRYCIGAHVSEKVFYHIVFHLLLMRTQGDAIKYIYNETNVKLSRQTLSRYWLMIGDHLYNKNFITYKSDEEMKEWSLQLYGCYRSLSLLPDDDNFPTITSISKDWSSNATSWTFFDRARDIIKTKKGLKFNVFTSWLGALEHIAKFWKVHQRETTDTEKADMKKFYRLLHEYTMSTLSMDPINPKTLKKYRLLLKEDGIEATELIGSRIVKCRFFTYE